MLKKIGVLGAGTMGHCIAESFAMHGYQVNVFEPIEEVRTTAIALIAEELSLFVQEEMLKEEDVASVLGRINFFDDLSEAMADRDYVIEAVPEKMELKQSLFKQLDDVCPAHTVIASNTSSLPLSEMTSGISEERKTRVMVCHWYNPGHIMPIAELSFFGNMSEELFNEVRDLYLSIGKQPVKVLKDIPGLIANRIQQAVAREVFSLIEMEAAAPEDIDRALMFGPAFRYATSGQLEIADFGGLDIWAIVGDNLLKEMDNRREANPLIKAKMKEGKLGVKTGEGFFSYPEDKIAGIKEKYVRKLITQLKVSKNYTG
ncbi:MAG: 3-hydroxyacyl-CoA dehydrogenase family protein [Spirochaetales bacterium]|uniref:3-hydroxyacyl-CoA dehydrogenase family protein n=1 Tax=Candidatus Thalassospirochaeta sargassi TaxID=3119039 RepID=A0AAJ1IIC3_9SPIO|nr:3-hydroxyacyl-CoA dehydrogenase family protein [Spirochaetales bacterium]